MFALPGIEERDCKKCSRRAGCSQVVWGDGQVGAPIMLIGETPRLEEDLVGEPLASREGQLLKPFNRW